MRMGVAVGAGAEAGAGEGTAVGESTAVEAPSVGFSAGSTETSMRSGDGGGVG
jgi:hypothetical protein